MMATRFKTIDRASPYLMPPSLQDWIPEDHIVHFILDAVNLFQLDSFHINRRGSGSEQYPPHMMCSLLICCYATGRFSSREIESATYSDVAVRFIAANLHPDHDTICKFRRDNGVAFKKAFVSVLELAAPDRRIQNSKHYSFADIRAQIEKELMAEATNFNKLCPNSIKQAGKIHH